MRTDVVDFLTYDVTKFHPIRIYLGHFLPEYVNKIVFLPPRLVLKGVLMTPNIPCIDVSNANGFRLRHKSLYVNS